MGGWQEYNGSRLRTVKGVMILSTGKWSENKKLQKDKLKVKYKLVTKIRRIAEKKNVKKGGKKACKIWKTERQGENLGKRE